MIWEVSTNKSVTKALPTLPKSVQDALRVLMQELEIKGPVRGNWQNYSKLGPNRHHCHIKKGRPTYVAIWVEISSAIKLIEVTYAGTHERAPY